MKQAGGIPIIFLTAYHLLRSLKSLQPGDTVLVQAAASGVGTVLIQLCKQWGFRSIATASTEAKLALARSLGADVTINYTAQDFEAEVMRLTQGVGVQLALEAVGGDVTVKSMRCLAPFGMLVNYGNASNQPASLPLSSFREQRAAMGFSLPATFPRSDNQAAMAEILDLLMANKVRLIVDQVLPTVRSGRGPRAPVKPWSHGEDHPGALNETPQHWHTRTRYRAAKSPLPPFAKGDEGGFS